MPLEILHRDAERIELRMTGFIGDRHDPESVWLRDLRAILAGHTGAVLLRIESRGGLAAEGFAMHDFLRGLPGPVTTRAEGFTGSAATAVLMAGHRIEIRAGSFIEIHPPRTWGLADPDCIAGMRDEIARAAASLAAIYARQTGRPAQRELEMLQRLGDRFMSAEEARAAGYVDAITPSRTCAGDLESAT